MSGMKFDAEKPMFDLIDPYFHRDLALVLTFGASKYKRDNWQKVKDARRRYIAALERHTNDYKRGELIDKESGLPHMAHISCNSMFIHWLDRRDNENSDV